MSLHSVATDLLVPPINLLFLAIAGFLLALRGRGVGRWILGVSLCALLLLALPIVSTTFLVMLEELPPSPAPTSPPAAIVILSGDVQHIGGAAPQVGIGPLTLERLRAAAALYRSTHLPVLTSGGVLGNGDPPLADLMALSLMQDFAVPTRWREDASHNTWENAERSAAILKSEGIDSVYLVTHAWHMRRALIAFSRFGITVTPAPTPPDKGPELRLASFVPSASAWLHSYYALHEWIGCTWYELRALVNRKA